MGTIGLCDLCGSSDGPQTCCSAPTVPEKVSQRRGPFATRSSHSKPMIYQAAGRHGCDVGFMHLHASAPAQSRVVASFLLVSCSNSSGSSCHLIPHITHPDFRGSASDVVCECCQPDLARLAPREDGYPQPFSKRGCDRCGSRWPLVGARLRAMLLL